MYRRDGQLPHQHFRCVPPCFTVRIPRRSSPFSWVRCSSHCECTGFCASEDLAAEDPEGLCGNYGLYDCVKMLEWVRFTFFLPSPSSSSDR